MLQLISDHAYAYHLYVSKLLPSSLMSNFASLSYNHRNHSTLMSSGALFSCQNLIDIFDVVRQLHSPDMSSICSHEHSVLEWHIIIISLHIFGSGPCVLNQWHYLWALLDNNKSLRYALILALTPFKTSQRTGNN